MRCGLAPREGLPRQVTAAGLRRPLRREGGRWRSGCWHLLLVDHGVMASEPGQAADLGSRNGREMVVIPLSAPCGPQLSRSEPAASLPLTPRPSEFSSPGPSAHTPPPS